MGPWVRLVALQGLGVPTCLGKELDPWVWSSAALGHYVSGPGPGPVPVGTAQGPCLGSQIPADMVPQRHVQTLACHSFSGLLARNQLISEHLSLRGSWLWAFGGQRFLELQGCFNSVSASFFVLNLWARPQMRLGCHGYDNAPQPSRRSPG